MATWLRQSTAVDIPLGPFVDSTDGFTPETGLSLTQAECRLKKNNGAWAQKNDATTGVHEEEGWYEIELDDTDTNTLGVLIVAVYISGALPVWREFLVVPAQVWDSYLSTDRLQVHAAEITNDLITAAAIATDAIGAAELADGAITAAKIATNAIDADSLAADAIAEINATVDQALSDYDGPTHAELVSEINSVQTDIAGVQADTDNIQTRLPAALVGGRIDSSVGAMATDVLTAASLNADAVAEIAGAISVPSSSANAAAVLAAVIESGMSLQDILRIVLSAVSGKSHSPAAGQRAYRDVGDTKNRILAQVSGGDRTTVTLDPS